MAKTNAKPQKKTKKHKEIYAFYYINALIIACSVLFDRLLKIYAIKKLKDHPSKALINGVLEFTYLENSGAAFGLLKGQKYFFILVAAVIFIAILYLYHKMPHKDKYKGANIALSLIAGGAIGNLIDRIAYNHVIDYIYFYVFHFPIFNLADVCVSVGTIILLILLLFVYKEDDLNFLRFKEKRLREIK